MLDFLKMLFFTKFVLLTPEFINFEGEYSIIPEKPISALNSYAHISIDVSHMMTSYQGKDVIAKLDAMKKVFPKNSISAYVIDLEGRTVKFDKMSHASSLRIILSASDAIIVGKEYKKIVLNSSISLNRVKVGWANSK
jgi:hypothetical protein